jgi:hypothetical protein
VTFDRTRIKSLDWSSYQIMRFTDTPDSVEVEVIDRPGQPFLGTGEVSQGPAAAAIANAVANATGQRLRELPFTRAKVKRRSVYRRDLLSYMPPGPSGAGWRFCTNRYYAHRRILRLRAQQLTSNNTSATKPHQSGPSAALQYAGRGWGMADLG